MRTRWLVVVSLILLACATWPSADPRATQNPIPSAQPHPRQESEGESNPLAPNAEKKALEENDKDMKKKVDRLFELATELKAEVDKTDSSKVLSLNLVKKAEEIEKLARDIKNKGKG
ncbi:MAG TPA: hypothetical protein VMJ35_00255 [Dongiaceae bacterium]|nr:hypothetical protein [Dongiaceae bacterium]